MGGRILIVEDSGIDAMALDALLFDLGYQVTVAGSLAATENHLGAGPFAAALVNAGLPDGPADALVERLLDAGCRVAVVSGGNGENLAAVGDGRSPLFGKPVNQLALLQWLSVTDQR